jgi:hypothetical protein
MGIAPSGKQLISGGICIDHIVDGKIVEEREEWDTFGMMQPLGAVPVAKVKPTARSVAIKQCGSAVVDAISDLNVNYDQGPSFRIADDTAGDCLCQISLLAFDCLSLHSRIACDKCECEVVYA